MIKCQSHSRTLLQSMKWAQSKSYTSSSSGQAEQLSCLLGWSWLVLIVMWGAGCCGRNKVLSDSRLEALKHLWSLLGGGCQTVDPRLNI